MYQVCSNESPCPGWVQDGPALGEPKFELSKYIKKIFKNLLLQNHLAQMLEIWYVALPSGPLPNLFKEGP